MALLSWIPRVDSSHKTLKACRCFMKWNEGWCPRQSKKKKKAAFLKKSLGSAYCFFDHSTFSKSLLLILPLTCTCSASPLPPGPPRSASSPGLFPLPSPSALFPFIPERPFMLLYTCNRKIPGTKSLPTLQINLLQRDFFLKSRSRPSSSPCPAHSPLWTCCYSRAGLAEYALPILG